MHRHPSPLAHLPLSLSSIGGRHHSGWRRCQLLGGNDEQRRSTEVWVVCFRLGWVGDGGQGVGGHGLWRRAPAVGEWQMEVVTIGLYPPFQIWVGFQVRFESSSGQHQVKLVKRHT
ncbi:putative mononegavirus L protein 2-O-ribose methyltransferase [Helianthus anomalus]